MLEKVQEFNPDKLIEEFESVSKNAERAQRETLKRILEDNASAEYLQTLGLNGRTDLETFKEIVPLVTHKDLEPYINRIIAGDYSSILTRKPITRLSLSSGTTSGKQKYVPWTDELVDATVQIYQHSYSFRRREFNLKNGKALSFIFSGKLSKTEGGLSVGTATTNLFSDKRYAQAMAAIKSESCSPPEVIFGSDFYQSLYCHLLCGLIFRDEIQIVSSTFAHTIVLAFRTFEQVWEELCNDIKTGVLSSRIDVPSVRNAVSKILKPNPELANLIHQKCTGLSNWYGLIQELFPNAKYVYGIMTGAMESYLKKLRHYAGDLPLVTSDYGASEGWIGTNINPNVRPEDASYTVLPHLAFYEFIPQSGVDPTPVGVTEVKIGQEYEVVITTPAGLYRYKPGDVVKVIGFYNSTPQLKFIRRSGLLLSINIDKNTETDLKLSVEAAANLLAEEKLEVVDYTSTVDRSKEPGHYIIFWEISGEASEELLAQCSNCLDKSFLDAGYISSRKVNNIEALQLHVVRRGTFQKVLEHFLAQGGTLSQFKTPRGVGTNPKVLQILKDNVVGKYISTAYKRCKH